MTILPPTETSLINLANVEAKTHDTLGQLFGMPNDIRERDDIISVSGPDFQTGDSGFAKEYPDNPIKMVKFSPDHGRDIHDGDTVIWWNPVTGDVYAPNDHQNIAQEIQDGIDHLGKAPVTAGRLNLNDETLWELMYNSQLLTAPKLDFSANFITSGEHEVCQRLIEIGLISPTRIIADREGKTPIVQVREIN